MLLKKQIKKYLLTTVIASLIASALVGITVLLLGSLGEIQYKVLFSTIAIGVFSITGLASIRHIESTRPSYMLFAYTSLATSLLALIFILWPTWIEAEVFPWELTVAIVILSLSFSHISLLLPLKLGNLTYVNFLIAATIFCIVAVASILISLVVLKEPLDNEAIYRILGVFAILDVLGTILSPLLSRLLTPKLAK